MSLSAQNLVNSYQSQIGNVNNLLGGSNTTALDNALSSLSSNNFWVQLEQIAKTNPSFIFQNPQLAQMLFSPEVQGYIRKAKYEALLQIIQTQQEEAALAEAIKRAQKKDVSQSANPAQLSGFQTTDYGSNKTQAASQPAQQQAESDGGGGVGDVIGGVVKEAAGGVVKSLVTKAVDWVKGLFS